MSPWSPPRSSFTDTHAVHACRRVRALVRFFPRWGQFDLDGWCRVRCKRPPEGFCFIIIFFLTRSQERSDSSSRWTHLWRVVQIYTQAICPLVPRSRTNVLGICFCSTHAVRICIYIKMVLKKINIYIQYARRCFFVMSVV